MSTTPNPTPWYEVQSFTPKVGPNPFARQEQRVVAALEAEAPAKYDCADHHDCSPLMYSCKEWDEAVYSDFWRNEDALYGASVEDDFLVTLLDDALCVEAVVEGHMGSPDPITVETSVQFRMAFLRATLA